MDTIENMVSAGLGVSVNAIRGKNRITIATEARHAIWFILRTGFNWSFPKIGAEYGRDHTTIMSGVDRIACGKVSEKTLDVINAVLLKENIPVRSTQERPVTPQLYTIEERKKNAERLGIELNHYLAGTTI